MKKLLSISFAFIILLSGMHFTVATHICGGKVAFTKLSVLGELASCGMEGGVDHCTSPLKLKAPNCCKDKVAAFVVDNSYSPTFFEFKALPQDIMQVFVIAEYLSVHSQFIQNFIYTDIGPPGWFLVSAVSLPKICVFRI